MVSRRSDLALRDELLLQLSHFSLTDRDASAMETLGTYSHLWPDSEDTTRAAIDVVLGGLSARLTHDEMAETAISAAQGANRWRVGL
jgi:hypothetical protein